MAQSTLRLSMQTRRYNDARPHCPQWRLSKREAEMLSWTCPMRFELMHERLHRSHFAADHAIGATKATLQTSGLIERSWKRRSEDAITKLPPIHHMWQLVTVRGWQSCCTLRPGFRSASQCTHWAANFAASHTIDEFSLCLLTWALT